MVLFVTVGNGKFEALVKEIDQLKGSGRIKEDVIVQLGHGKYKPQHCKWFTFESPLDPYYKKARVVISHGGPGIVFEVLRRKKKLLAVPNRNRTDPRHQVEYLRAMAKETPALLYCDKVSDLLGRLGDLETHEFATYSPSECRMPEVIHTFLSKRR